MLKYFFAPADCGPPPHIERSTYPSGPTLEGDIIDYLCDNDTIADGITRTECLITGLWSDLNLRCRGKIL